MISIIVATDKNGCIGKDGQIPWKCKGDMKYFKEKTLYHPVIMGRKTWEAIPGGKLKERANIVVSSIPQKEDTWDFMFAHSFPDAIFKAQTSGICNDGDKEIFVIGGQSVYNYFLKMGNRDDLCRVDRIYLNIIDTEVENGDAFFPIGEIMSGDGKYGMWKLIEKLENDEFTSYVYDKIDKENSNE